jgi:cytochrome c peroxidase
MRFKVFNIALLTLFLLIIPEVFAQDDLQNKAKSLLMPIPDNPPEFEDNPATIEKIELGKMLYFEPRLSASHLISCNTCHNLGTGGVDLQETSVGHGWQKGPRNAPTVLNAVFNIAQFWDGRAKDLADQAKGPVQATVEMNNSPQRLVSTLKSMPQYRDLFANAFPEQKEHINFENTVKAIEAFEATLLTPDSRFDKFLKGDNKALSSEEKNGLKLFMDKGCASCHNGVNLGGNSYFPFGVVKNPGAEILPPGDKGRFKVTKTASDEYVFKVPTLRNIQLTPPYFHSGKVWSLNEAVSIMGSSQLGIKLSDNEIKEITIFLKSLNGKQPKIEYPILPPNTEDTPKPILKDINGVNKGH